MDRDHKHKEGGQLDYNSITDGIFVGNNQCCKAGLSEVLKKEGVTADISLEQIQMDQPFGVEIYVWLPTPDHASPSMDQLVFGAKALAEIVRQGRRVYVHCKNGHGRAPTLVSAYLIMAKGMGAEGVEDFMRSKRPSVHFQEAQRERLVEFEGLV